MKFSGTLFDLAGRVALVTGSSKGLGLAVARMFAQAGADVFICSRHAAELEAAAAVIGDGLPGRVEWAEADLSDASQVEHLANVTLARFGRVDILVNNAGTNVPQRI